MDKDDKEKIKEVRRAAEKPVEWGTRDEELVLSVEGAGLELVYLEKIDEEDEKGEKASTERGSRDESFVDNIEKTEDPKRKN